MLGSTLVTGLRERNGALLITQRSQVQILPPLQVKVQVRGPFSLRGGRASGVVVNGWSTWLATGRGRTWAAGYHLPVGCGAMPTARTGPAWVHSGTGLRQPAQGGARLPSDPPQSRGDARWSRNAGGVSAPRLDVSPGIRASGPDRGTA